MSVVLDKVNASAEFGAIPGHITEAEWSHDALAPVLATPATVTPTLANITLGAAAFTAGIAVGDALFG
ncbi:hypothetical protein ABT354_25640 [Streptomyces sp. NPDC000594]|uniref:hypothetical protein n=1 Tax=Streptomyces sp. NPDC000594 TaxID=3154261 RepID=UPI00331BD7B0